MITSHTALLRMRNISDKSCRENQNTFYVQFFFFLSRAVYKIVWNSMVEPDRPRMTMWRIACWIPQATNTNSQYVILIAFPLQQWLYERASLFRYTYIACLVTFLHSSDAPRTARHCFSLTPQHPLPYKSGNMQLPKRVERTLLQSVTVVILTNAEKQSVLGDLLMFNLTPSD
jgi:hypothetical protein